MRLGAAGALVRPDLARKLIGVAVVGGASAVLLGGMAVLGLSLTAVTIAFFLAAAATATILCPEVGLFALLINALVGLTHIVELPRVGPLSIPIAFEGVLAMAFAVQIALGRRRLFLDAPQHALVFILSFWVVVSLLVSGHVGEENYEALRNLYVVRVLIFLLVTNILSSRASLHRLLAVFAVSNVGLIVVSIATRIGYFGQERVVTSDRMLRTSALVHNPNTLAFELTTMLILAVFMFLYVERRWLKAALLVLALADGSMILSTLSRSGFISLMVVLLFMFFKLTRSARAIALVLILFLIVGLLSGSGLVQRFKRIDEIRDVDRYGTAVVGLNATYDNPVFGVGLGNFVRNFDRYNTMHVQQALPAHNMYLDLSAQMGLPALLLYLGILGVTWWRMRSMEVDLKRRGRSRSFLCMFTLAVQCFLVNLCVFGLSGDVEFEYSVFTMIGLGMLLYRLYRQEGEAEGRGGPVEARARGGGPAPGGPGIAGPVALGRPARSA